MAEQILIEFIGDASQLVPAIDVLEQMGQIDAKAAEAFRKGNAEMTKRAQTVKAVTAEDQKHLKTLNDLTKAVGALAGATPEEAMLGLSDALDEAGVSAKELTDEIHKLDSAEVSLKKQLKDMTAQLALMEVQGKRNTAEYNELVIKAGELKDSIGDANEAIANAGSDTRGLDNLISLASGVAGGFAVAQGAAALLGNENEELQKTMLKVQAAMSILMGLQQIQALLSQRQFQSTAALIGIQRIQTAQTFLQSGAESSYVVVKYASIAAQKVLNAVMAANPVGLLIAGLVAVVLAIKAFTSDTKDAAEAQQELNDQFEQGSKRLDAYKNDLDDATKVRIAELKKQGASSKQIRDEEIEGLKKRLKATKDFVNENRSTFLQSARDLSDETLNLTKEEAEKKQKFLDDYNAKRKEENDLDIELQILKLNNETETSKEILDKRKDAAAKSIELAKRNAQAIFEIEQRRLQYQSELLKAAVDREENGFSLRLMALKQYEQSQTDLIELQRKKELSAANLTPLEKLNINKKFDLDLQKLTDDTYTKRNELIRKKDEELKAQNEAAIADLTQQEKDKAQLILDNINAIYPGLKSNNGQEKDARLTQLEEEYKSGLLSLEQYQQKREAISKEYAERDLGNEKVRLEAVIEQMKAAGEDTTPIEQQLYDVKEQMRQADLEKEKIYNETKQQLEQQLYDRKAQLADAFFNGVSASIFDGQKQRLEEEAQANQDLLDKKAISQDEFNKRQEKLKRQESQINKNKAIVDIFINMAKEVFAIKAQAAKLQAEALSNPFKLPLVGIALAQIPFVIGSAVAQAAFISSRKFKHGEVLIDGPGTETSDSIPAMLSKNESVIHAKASRKYKPALEAMNKMKFDEYIAGMIPNPVPAEIMSGYSGGSSLPFDYSRLAKEIAAEVGNLKDIPGVDVQIDERGISIIAKKGMDRTEFLNKKYSFK